MDEEDEKSVSEFGVYIHTHVVYVSDICNMATRRRGSIDRSSSVTECYASYLRGDTAAGAAAAEGDVREANAEARESTAARRTAPVRPSGRALLYLSAFFRSQLYTQTLRRRRRTPRIRRHKVPQTLTFSRYAERLRNNDDGDDTTPHIFFHTTPYICNI